MFFSTNGIEIHLLKGKCLILSHHEPHVPGCSRVQDRIASAFLGFPNFPFTLFCLLQICTQSILSLLRMSRLMGEPQKDCGVYSMKENVTPIPPLIQFNFFLAILNLHKWTLNIFFVYPYIFCQLQLKISCIF